ncbi:MAG: tetratricopeptide repeat protein [Cyanobacteria bacterium NC_groundwater_1444_Ag_S-0.65um_54_12]|nr:tetratricopeptide repeat protein [Cyanobacteria bacterium NC_groundwater_1444_Ag_S-0.65um_54_12]
MDPNQQTFQEAVAHFQSGNLDEAMKGFVQVDRRVPKLQASAMSYIGRIHTLRGDWEEAEKALRRSLAMQAVVDPQSLYALSECYFQQCKWVEAEKYLRETIAREPQYTDAYIRLGMVLREQKRLDEAVRSFELAILNDQKAVMARYQLAQICAGREDYKRALSQLHFVKNLVSDYIPAYVLQGDIYQRLGDHRQAIVEYVRATQLGRADAALCWRLGRSFMAIRDRLQAVKAFEQALRFDQQMWPAYFYAAQIRDELQHYEQAIVHYQALLQVDEYRTLAKEAIARLMPHVPGFDPGKASTIAEDMSFEAPPVTTNAAATDTLDAIHRQLTSRIGTARTAPIKMPTALQKDHKWLEDETATAEEEDDLDPSPYPGRYSGIDVVDQLSSALHAGAVSEAMNILRNSSLQDITESLRSRLDHWLQNSKVPVQVKSLLAKQHRKKPSTRC